MNAERSVLAFLIVIVALVESAFGAGCKKVAPTSPVAPACSVQVGDGVGTPTFGPAWSGRTNGIFVNHTVELSIVPTMPRPGYCGCLQRIDYSTQGLWWVDIAGGHLHRVTDVLEWPEISPSGDWIAFEYGGQIWRMKVDSDRADSSSLVQASSGNPHHNPGWSPDGKRLSWVGWQEFGTIGMNGDDEHDYQGYVESVSWDPRGNALLLCGALVGDSTVIEDFDLSTGAATIVKVIGLANFDRVGFTCFTAKYSPDRKWIGYILKDYSEDVGSSLWLMNADGSMAHKCVNLGVGEVGFSWSPDSKKIAYVAFEGRTCTRENGTLWVVDVASGSRKQMFDN